jgi:hypothetical protein
VQQPLCDEIFGSRTVRRHVRRRHVRAERFAVGPFFDNDERVGAAPKGVKRTSARTSCASRSPFEIAGEAARGD